MSCDGVSLTEEKWIKTTKRKFHRASVEGLWTCSTRLTSLTKWSISCKMSCETIPSRPHCQRQPCLYFYLDLLHDWFWNEVSWKHGVKRNLEKLSASSFGENTLEIQHQNIVLRLLSNASQMVLSRRLDREQLCDAGAEPRVCVVCFKERTRLRGFVISLDLSTYFASSARLCVSLCSRLFCVFRSNTWFSLSGWGHSCDRCMLGNISTRIWESVEGCCSRGGQGSFHVDRRGLM